MTNKQIKAFIDYIKTLNALNGSMEPIIINNGRTQLIKLSLLPHLLRDFTEDTK